MKQRIARLTAAVAALVMPAATAFAADAPINPGERIGQWITSNVGALFIPILGVVSIYYLAKRQFTQFISFAVFAVIVSLFVFAGDSFKDMAVSLSRWIIGG
ncbi:MAG: hypothetical protein K0R39_4761 [Symbiobacteriaceae bacterium]|nr:hypothetical protein [Symbiobacteriaceae bacterium]